MYPVKEWRALHLFEDLVAWSMAENFGAFEAALQHVVLCCPLHMGGEVRKCMAWGICGEKGMWTSDGAEKEKGGVGLKSEASGQRCGVMAIKAAPHTRTHPTRHAWSLSHYVK